MPVGRGFTVGCMPSIANCKKVSQYGCYNVCQLKAEQNGNQ